MDLADENSEDPFEVAASLSEEDWAPENRGDIIFEETEKDAKKRRIGLLSPPLILIVTIIGIALPLPFLFGEDICTPVFLFFGLIGALMLVLLFAKLIRDASSFGPFIVYEKGILLNAKRFLPFEEIFYVEEVEDVTTSLPKTVITPVYVRPIVVIAGSTAVGPAGVVLSEYETVRDIIKRKAFEEGADILDWDEGAIGFLQTLEWEKGAVMASAEEVARGMDIDSISLDFILQNHEEIAKSVGYRRHYFRKAARQALSEMEVEPG